jgi:hypothetical protein
MPSLYRPPALLGQAIILWRIIIYVALKRELILAPGTLIGCMWLRDVARLRDVLHARMTCCIGCWLVTTLATSRLYSYRPSCRIQTEASYAHGGSMRKCASRFHCVPCSSGFRWNHRSVHAVGLCFNEHGDKRILNKHDSTTRCILMGKDKGLCCSSKECVMNSRRRLERQRSLDAYIAELYTQ